jgi:hypothetical protein
VPKTSDIEMGDKIFALFKGEPGSGKTVAAGSFPGPIYFFDMDGRMKPLKKMFPDRTDISYDTFTINDYVKFENKFNMIIGRNDYATVVLDSLTSMALTALKYSLTTRGKEGLMKGVIQLREIEDYGVEAQVLIDILEELRKLKCHVIVTAHVLETEQTDIKKKVTTRTRTLLTGGKKVAAMIPKNFDEVWHFDVQTSPEIGKAPMRSIYTDTAGEDFAKTALPLPFEVKYQDNLWRVVSGILEMKGIKFK